MSSKLYRLFRYTKGEGDALENYTTEALAQAIAVDALPFLRAVRGAGVILPGDDDVVRTLVATQVGVVGAGVIDLIVSIESRRDTRDVWVEVKRFATESGDQLSRYASAIANRSSEMRPALVVVSPRRIADGVPWVPWQNVWRLAKGHPDWSDFRTFLEDTRMANRFDVGITAREATSQGNAHVLLRKLENAVVPAIDHGRSIAPALKWPPRRRRVRYYMLKHLAEWGALTAGTRFSQKFGVSLGSYDDPEAQESFAGVRVWYDHRRSDVLSAILPKAAGLPRAFWDVSPADDDGAVVSAYSRLVGFSDLASLTSWYCARLDELASTGVLETLASLKAGPPPSEDEEDDEEAEDA